MVPRAPLPSEELEKGPTDGTRRRCVSAHTFGLPAARGGAAGIEGGKRKTANCQSHARMYILYNTRVREKQTKSKTCVCHNPQWLGRSAAAEHQLMLRDLARGGRRGGGAACRCAAPASAAAARPRPRLAAPAGRCGARPLAPPITSLQQRAPCGRPPPQPTPDGSIQWIHPWCGWVCVPRGTFGRGGGVLLANGPRGGEEAGRGLVRRRGSARAATPSTGEGWCKGDLPGGLAAFPAQKGGRGGGGYVAGVPHWDGRGKYGPAGASPPPT